MCFFLQAEDGIRDGHVTGVQTCALPISGTKNQSKKESPGSPGETPEGNQLFFGQRPGSPERQQSGGHHRQDREGKSHRQLWHVHHRGSFGKVGIRLDHRYFKTVFYCCSRPLASIASKKPYKLGW